MKTSHFVFALATLSPLAGALPAQTPVPVPASRPVTIAGPTDRVSKSTATAVSAGITFATPVPEKKPEPPTPAETDADEPRNGIVRLPSYIVQEQRPPVFRDRDIYTKKGMGELALNRYFSETSKALNRYKLPFVGMSAESYARMLYEEDERLQNMQDTQEKISILRQTDPVAAEQMKKEMDQTFIRRSQFSTAPGGSAK